MSYSSQYMTIPTGGASKVYSPPAGGSASVSTDRGKEWTAILMTMVTGSLRIGAGLKVLGFITASVAFSVMTHLQLKGFSFDLFTAPESVRYAPKYHLALIAISWILLSGAMSLAHFQIFLSDNSKLSRGFRLGSKFLSTAIVFDLITISLRLMQYFYATNFIADKWWLRFSESTADWCLLHMSSFTHVISLCFYGLGIFYLETYSAHTHQEMLGWMVLSVFSLASLTGFLNMITNKYTWTFMIEAFGWILALIWACTFEPTQAEHAAVLHDRDVLNDLQ